MSEGLGSETGALNPLYLLISLAIAVILALVLGEVVVIGEPVSSPENLAPKARSVLPRIYRVCQKS